jgi:hypothetical protein
MNLKTVTTAFFFLAAITLLLCPLPCPAQDVSQAGSPTIKSVSLITAQQYQTITIKGSGFGTHAPYTGDSYFISFFDLKTGEPSWQAGYSGYNDTITLIVNSWTNTKIVLGGFSGAWDQAGYDYTLGVGDSAEVQVWNPQTGEGPSNFYSSVSTEPTTTTITSSPNPSNLDHAVTFTATVTSSAGSPPDGEGEPLGHRRLQRRLELRWQQIKAGETGSELSTALGNAEAWFFRRRLICRGFLRAIVADRKGFASDQAESLVARMFLQCEEISLCLDSLS